MVYRSAQIKEAIKRSAESLEENKQELNKLDAAIGDGDHGRSISRAFNGMVSELEELNTKDIGELLKEAGKQVVFSSGAAAGPLFGTGIMRAGEEVEGQTEIALKDIAQMFSAAEEGIKDRGGGEVGEKTMLDTIDPAREALEAAADEGLEEKEAFQRVIKAAEQGKESTKNMVSERGRSSRLGERTKGHIDPGAASSAIIIRALFESCIQE